MTRPTILILGQSTSGKTTLGRNAVSTGRLGACIEIDDVDNWLGKAAMLKKLTEEEAAVRWSNPWFMDLSKNSATAVGRMAYILPEPVGISGVWPGDKLHYVTRCLQDYRAVVITPHTYEEARNLWESRGGKLKGQFGKLFTEKTWEKNSLALVRAAFELHHRGRYLEQDDQLYLLEWDQHPIMRPWDIIQSYFDVLKGGMLHFHLPSTGGEEVVCFRHSGCTDLADFVAARLIRPTEHTKSNRLHADWIEALGPEPEPCNYNPKTHRKAERPQEQEAQ